MFKAIPSFPGVHVLGQARMTAKGEASFTLDPVVIVVLSQLLYQVIEAPILLEPETGVTKHGDAALEATREFVF